MSALHQLCLTADEVNALRFCLGQGTKRCNEIKLNKEYKTDDKNKATMYELKIQDIYRKMREIEI